MTRNNNARFSCNWNEYDVKTHISNYWRASLVPAAAVIPAPIAYIKVVAVKKLVVKFLAFHENNIVIVKCIVLHSVKQLL